MIDPISTQALIQQILDDQEMIESPCRPEHYRVLMRMVSNTDNHLALSFGAGSVPALGANTALVSILEELQIRPFVKEIWGTSAGAIVGGTWCTGTSAQGIYRLIDSLNRRGAIDIPKWEIYLKGLVRFLLFKKVPEGLVRGRHFYDTICRGLKVQTFEDCPIPFRVIACTDDGFARKIVFKSGPLAKAIFASMCLPGIMFPVLDWQGKSIGYMDGGVVERTPLLSIIEEHLRMGRSQNLLILSTYISDDARIEKPIGFINRFSSTMDRMQEVVWEYQRSEALKYPNTRLLVLNPHLRTGGTFDFENLKLHYLWSRKMFKEQLSNAKIAERFNAR
jgi:predicted acylesterase/phospholipase RssA